MRTPTIGELLASYLSGHVPWDAEDGLVWHLPTPRYFLDLNTPRFPNDVWKRYRRQGWRPSVNEAFNEVVEKCATAERGDTVPWLTSRMREAYSHLHAADLAWSFELWDGDRLVAGEFGLPIGGAYICESKFHEVSGAGSFCTGITVMSLSQASFQIYDAQYGPKYLSRFSTSGLLSVEGSEFPRLLAEASVARFEATTGQELQRPGIPNLHDLNESTTFGQDATWLPPHGNPTTLNDH